MHGQKNVLRLRKNLFSLLMEEDRRRELRTRGLAATKPLNRITGMIKDGIELCVVGLRALKAAELKQELDRVVNSSTSRCLSL